MISKKVYLPVFLGIFSTFGLLVGFASASRGTSFHGGMAASESEQLLTPSDTNIIYVDADASGGNDGSSWETAYIDLQDALTTAISSNRVACT